MGDTLDVVVDLGDVGETAADAVLLKYAQGFHGADGAVARRLEGAGVGMDTFDLLPGDHRFIETRRCLGAPVVLFLGTVRLRQFGYHEIRQFSVRALQLLESRQDVRHLACTVHGPNYGLDEDEAVLALVGGFVDAF
ncbi:hypothetical protein [Corallococcus sp. AB049A]|nr:hypothetical protein [Corallococcus sp. AB049A]